MFALPAQAAEIQMTSVHFGSPAKEYCRQLRNFGAAFQPVQEASNEFFPPRAPLTLTCVTICLTIIGVFCINSVSTGSLRAGSTDCFFFLV